VIDAGTVGVELIGSITDTLLSHSKKMNANLAESGEKIDALRAEVAAAESDTERFFSLLGGSINIALSVLGIGGVGVAHRIGRSSGGVEVARAVTGGRASPDGGADVINLADPATAMTINNALSPAVRRAIDKQNIPLASGPTATRRGLFAKAGGA